VQLVVFMVSLDEEEEVPPLENKVGAILLVRVDSVSIL
jgi:hypothetical protein